MSQGKMLVAYLSRSGNTRVIAGTLHRLLGAELFEIAPRHPIQRTMSKTWRRPRRSAIVAMSPASRVRSLTSPRSTRFSRLSCVG
jgi:flavodoxin